MKEKKYTKILYFIGTTAVSAALMFLFLFLPYIAQKYISKRRAAKTMHIIKEKIEGLSVTEENVIGVLKLIDDPEFQINIYDLGIVKDIKIHNKNVEIILQIYPQCPYKIELYLMVKRALEEMDGIGEVHIKIVPAENWDYLKMQKDSRLKTQDSSLKEH